jgi:hypothetical protein
MEGGCPGRTRATRTRPLLDATETAWTYEAPARIDGDPLVSDEWVVVLSRTPERAHLDVLRLADGKAPFARRSLPARATLVGLWRDLVYLAGEGVPQVLRISPELGSLLTVADMKFSADACVVDGDVYSPEFLSLRHVRLGQPKSGWSAQADGIAIGPAAVGHGRVWWPVEDTAFVPGVGAFKDKYRIKVSLASVDLDGQNMRHVRLKWGEERKGEAPPRARVLVGESEIVVHHEGGPDPSITGTRVVVLPGEPAKYEPSTRSLNGLDTAPIAWGRRTVFSFRFEDDYSLAFTFPPAVAEKNALRPEGAVADRRRHREFSATPHRLTVANGLVLHPAGVFEMETGRIRGARPWPHASVVVPTRETVLTVEGDARRLVARRAKPHKDAEGPRLATDEGGGPRAIPGATVLTADGVVRSGTVTVAPNGQVSGLAKGPWTLADLGLVLDGDGRIVHGPDVGVVARALARVAKQGKGKEWTALARRAFRSGDEALSHALLDDLVRHGGKTDDYLVLRAEIDRLAAGPTNKSTVLPKVVEEVTTRRGELLREEAALSWKAFASLPGDTPVAYRIEVLRCVLSSVPDHPEAVAWLRERLPEGVIPSPVGDAAPWLDLVEVASRVPLRRVTAKTGADATDDERALASATAGPGKDAIGLRSERLLLMTSVASPGRIARCLALGELACSELDRLYGVASKPDVPPLAIKLHVSREELVKAVPTAKSSPTASESVGHYVPEDRVSHLVVPADDGEFAKVVPAIVHELTRHWLGYRMPKGVPDSQPPSDAPPGYFLEAGFATFLGEARIDLPARAVALDDARAHSVDVVAHAPKLLPWDQILTMSRAGVSELPNDRFDFYLRWVLGGEGRMSAANVFHAQAGAACHWMFHADAGKRRPVLLSWIQDFRAGRTKSGDVEERLGMSAADVGKAIVTWAEKVSRGG